MAGVQAWISTFRSKDSVLFTVNKQHGNKELRAVLGDDFPGVLVSDRFKVYDSHTLDNVKQQKCLAHTGSEKFVRISRTLSSTRCGSDSKRLAWN